MKAPSPAETHVVIAGAGIAGMAAAMLLAEAGVRVTLCEAAPEAGGKAKSLRTADGHPTEHSLRVYADDYQTLLALFSRIPTDNGMTVLDNLVGVTAVRIYNDRSIGRAVAPVALKRGRSTFSRIVGKALAPFEQLGRIVLRSAMAIVGLARRGVALRDIINYLHAHIRLLWMCKERVVAELGDISYAEYLQLSDKSPEVQTFFTALPRIFVAARPEAEAAALAPVILKGMFHFPSCPPALNGAKASSIMMMNGPTSERMVAPWIRHLQNLGVDIHFNTRIDDLKFEGARITALTSADGRRFACDYAILALPYATLREIGKSDYVKQFLPGVAEDHAIQLEASNGIQCFLSDLPATWPSYVRPGAVGTYFESEWAIIAVLQGEGFWKDVRLPEGTKYVLSITWSDVDKPGRVFHRPASECTGAEILAECLAQCGLDQSNILGWEIDHELKFLSEAEYESLRSTLPPHLALPPSRGIRMVNLSPLAILMPGARRRSPRIRTEVPNLFLAGEAIHSPLLTIFVPTMERAATSGYLAAHKIINLAAPHAAPGLRIDFQDLTPFAFLRRLDRWRWDRRRTQQKSLAMTGLQG